MQTKKRIHHQYLLLGQKTLINYKVMCLPMLLVLTLALRVKTRLKSCLQVFPHIGDTSYSIHVAQLVKALHQHRRGHGFESS